MFGCRMGRGMEVLRRGGGSCRQESSRGCGDHFRMNLGGAVGVLVLRMGGGLWLIGGRGLRGGSDAWLLFLESVEYNSGWVLWTVVRKSVALHKEILHYLMLYMLN